MPGYILHLTAAQMFLQMKQKDYEILMDPQERNAFLIGNLLPDTTKIKDRSHFRNPKYHDHMVEYPETKWFEDKYQGILTQSSVLGYLFHLYIDRRFFKDYIPEIVEFRNENDQKELKREKVKYVFLKRTRERILKQDFFSEKYYYGDYTKMNTYLVERYHIPIRLDPDIENPGIEEVCYDDVRKVLGELEGYLKVPESAVKDIKVFDIEDLLSFLEKAVKEFCVQKAKI